MNYAKRLKKIVLAAGGLFAFNVAGCNFLDQFQSLIPDISSLVPPGLVG